MVDTPDTSHATDNVPLDRRTGGKAVAGRGIAPDTKRASGKPAEKKTTTNKQLEKIASDFLDRTKTKDDTGGKPGFLERQIVDSSWGQVVILSDLAMRAMGKDYELSRLMLQQYLTGDGDPLVYNPPAPVQEAIRKKFPSPGHWKDV